MPKSPRFSELQWSPIERRVALVAPASAIAEEVLEATLRQLEVLGVDYHLGTHADARYRYLAGTPEQRLEDFHTASSWTASAPSGACVAATAVDNSSRNWTGNASRQPHRAR